MKESEIIKAIGSKVSYYPAWIIGITDDPNRRRESMGIPPVGIIGELTVKP